MNKRDLIFVLFLLVWFFVGIANEYYFKLVDSVWVSVFFTSIMSIVIVIQEFNRRNKKPNQQNK